jgi:hypothetical protein
MPSDCLLVRQTETEDILDIALKILAFLVNSLNALPVGSTEAYKTQVNKK